MIFILYLNPPNNKCVELWSQLNSHCCPEQCSTYRHPQPGTLFHAPLPGTVLKCMGQYYRNEAQRPRLCERTVNFADKHKSGLTSTEKKRPKYRRRKRDISVPTSTLLSALQISLTKTKLQCVEGQLVRRN